MNNNMKAIRDSVASNTRMMMPGQASFVVDGQFGSTGKGLLSGLYAELFAGDVDLVASNAGPNSGHTNFYGGEKIVLRQLPTFSVTAKKMGHTIDTYLDAGAVIDMDVLKGELDIHDVPVIVNPWAAVINQSHKEAETQLVEKSGSTGKGIGAAIAEKVMRKNATFGSQDLSSMGENVIVDTMNVNAKCCDGKTVFVEVSQGYSLGLNSGFYPHCTSRECTVSQAMADLGLNPMFYGACSMVLRTYPIRIAGDSGPGYHGQREITWSDIGVEPELTTVTQKVRRVFEWSDQQVAEAISVNRPEVILLNFCNYLKSMSEVNAYADRLNWIHKQTTGLPAPVLLLGFGPKSEQVILA